MCLEKSVISGIWRKAIITPVFKGKGEDVMDPLSYRPVSLISNLCKGFSYILNRRILSYLEERNALVEEQNGFRQGRSCQDHVFTLTMAIKARLLQKKSTYFCFVDFTAAFDNVDRDLLKFVLKDIRVEGHIVKVIREIY